MIWVGVDPGASHTGIVIRDVPHGGLVDRILVTRDGDEATVDRRRGIQVGPQYALLIHAAVTQAITVAVDHLRGTAVPAEDAAPVRVAVEDLTAPGGFVRRADGGQRLVHPRDLAGAAKALAYVELAVSLDDRADLVRVPPDSHGQHLLSAYPAELVTDRERQHGLARPARHGALVNHLRSAWDVAGAGPSAARIQTAMDITRRAATGPHRKTKANP